MRLKMKLVRQTHETKVLKDAWAKWRQLYQSRLSEQHHKEWIVRRSLRVWRMRLKAVEGMEGRAELFEGRREEGVIIRAWDMWRRGAELRVMEGAIANRVAKRMARNVLKVWKKQM